MQLTSPHVPVVSPPRIENRNAPLLFGGKNGYRVIACLNQLFPKKLTVTKHYDIIDYDLRKYCVISYDSIVS